jgi:hypothetical protein
MEGLVVEQRKVKKEKWRAGEMPIMKVDLRGRRHSWWSDIRPSFRRPKRRTSNAPENANPASEQKRE